jgi:hypothetical protein
MRFRNLPFVGQRPAPRPRKTVSGKMPSGAMMNGLTPLGVGAKMWGPAGPGSGFGDYGGEFPNSGYLSGPVPSSGGIPVPPPPPNSTSVLVMRADTTKPPGFPGFYAWLADANPAAFNYAMATTPPHLVSASKVLRTSAATLQGLDDADLRKLYSRTFPRDSTQRSDLGDTTGSGYVASTSGATPATISTTFDSSTVAAPTMPPIATGESTSSPTLTPAGTAQLVTALTSAGQAIVTGVNNQTVFNAQLSRAEQGLPPLNTSAYGLTGSGITSALTDPTTLLMIAGGIGLLVFLSSKKSA